MPDFAFDETPWFHKLLFLDLLMLYKPELRNKYERLYGLISFRESAKSTAANTLFVSYLVANNGRTFKINDGGEVREFLIRERTIVIISETNTSAEEFTTRIRDSFTENERLRYFYRMEIQDAVDSFTGQWTRGSFRINNCYVIAAGSGQQIRGKVKGASRPSLVIADDIYSENNIITEDRRRRTRNWWSNAVMNSIDNLTGKVVVLGTILHDDTIVSELRQNPRWRHREIPVMPLDMFEKFVKLHLKVNFETGTCVLPHDDIQDRDDRRAKQQQYFDNVQASLDWQLAWPQRIDLYLLAIKYQEAMYSTSLSGLYQEYFHVTASPFERKFKKEYFQALQPYDIKFDYGYNWFKHKEDKDWQRINIEFGVDLAGSGPDDAVITVVGSLSNAKILVLHQTIGKFSIRDSIREDSGQDIRYSKVTLDRSRVERVGIVDEAFRLYLKWKPSKIKIGKAAQEDLVVEEFRRVFEENRAYDVAVLPRPQVGGREALSKIDRILNTLLRHYETHMVYHTPHLDKLEYQLEYLKSSKHDDCADSAEVAFWMIEFPENLSMSFFEPVKKDYSVKPYWLIPDNPMPKNEWRWL